MYDDTTFRVRVMDHERRIEHVNTTGWKWPPHDTGRLSRLRRRLAKLLIALALRLDPARDQPIGSSAPLPPGG